MMSPRRREKFERVIAARRPDLTVVMEDIHDPHNVSAMLRSADAVGVMEVQLLYDRDAFPKLGRKSSASASKWVRTRRFSSVAECYAKLREEGFLVCATKLGKRAVPLFKMDLKRKVALVFGNEHRGVSTEAAKLADVNFMIPMKGMIESLNVSVACAVTLYEALRQRSEAEDVPLTGKEQALIDNLREEWLRPPRRKK